jgi:hypothetical protein
MEDDEVKKFVIMMKGKYLNEFDQQGILWIAKKMFLNFLLQLEHEWFHFIL